jgi:hypothetical protein
MSNNLQDSNLRHKAVSRLKPLCSNAKQWQAFLDYIDILISEQHKKLEQSGDVVALHQAQGAIHVLRTLKYLKEEALKTDG